MKMHFDLIEVDRLLQHSKQATDHRMLYEGPETKQPGLWLVGDDGIYLMSNGLPPLWVDPEAKEEDKKNVVSYARECNPHTMHFDAWWASKRASWGGDDSIVFFTAEELDQALKTYPLEEPLALEIGRDSIGLYAWRPAPSLKKDPKKKRAPKRPADYGAST